MDKVKNYYTNYDMVLKNASTVYADKSLRFFGIRARVTGFLSAEHTEVTIHDRFSDQVLKLDNGHGVNLEWQAELGKDDLLRFAGYNSNLVRVHKIPFDTIILTRKLVGKSRYEGGSLLFTPKIINLDKRNGREIIKKVLRQLDKGEPVDPLEVIYLPLCSNRGISYEDMYREIIDIVPRITKDKYEQGKMLVLSALLVNKIISDDAEFTRILEVINMAYTDHEAVKLLVEKLTETQVSITLREVAKNLLADGVPFDKIRKSFTILSNNDLLEIQQEVNEATST